MELVKILTSTTLSKKLKELGVPQRSLFYWELLTDDIYTARFCAATAYKANFTRSTEKEVAAAFTADEIIKLVPAMITSEKSCPDGLYYLDIAKINNNKKEEYYIKYVCGAANADKYGNVVFSYLDKLVFGDENLANALAKMLIALIEKGHVSFNKN